VVKIIGLTILLLAMGVFVFVLGKSQAAKRV
jgi:hypothetical protein